MIRQLIKLLDHDKKLTLARHLTAMLDAELILGQTLERRDGAARPTIILWQTR